MNRWFRFYHEALDDPKVQMMRPELFKFWVNLLCLAARNEGRLPEHNEEIAFALRLDTKQVDGFVAELVDRALLDDGEELRPHNWDARQYKSDVSTERVKRYRETKRNVSCNESETPPDTEADTDNTSSLRSDVARKQREPNGSRLPEGWTPSAGQPENPQELEKFRDYWSAMAGAKARKRDWDAAWRNWLRNAADWRGGRDVKRSPNGMGSPLTTGSPVSAASLPGKHFVALDSPQWFAWAKHKGRSPPQTDCRTAGGIKRGWFFETEWPPGAERGAA